MEERGEASSFLSFFISWRIGQVNDDQKLGLVLILFCIILWFYAIPCHIVGKAPKFFPRLVTIFILIPSILLVLTRRGGPRETPQRFRDLKGIHKALATAGLFILYISFIDFIGYFTSSFVAIMVFMLFFGSRSWKGIIFIPATILFFIYIVIVKILSFPLPKGLIY
jgi:hypothetical protein